MSLIQIFMRWSGKASVELYTFGPVGDRLLHGRLVGTTYSVAKTGLLVVPRSKRCKEVSTAVFFRKFLARRQ